MLRQALAALGVDRFVLAIHDVSFPSRADEDVGRGSPYSAGADDFFHFVQELGFDGVQFGPQGETSPGNPSPYDGSVFSKSLQSLALAELTTERWGALLAAQDLREVVEDARARIVAGRADHAHAFQVQHAMVRRASQALLARVRAHDPGARALAAAIDEFAQACPWLTHDALFEALRSEHGTDDWRRWPDEDQALAAPSASESSRARAAMLWRRHRSRVRAFTFAQYVLADQHRRLRERLAPLGLAIYGDLQVGLSLRDTWSRGGPAGLFLEGHAMGAPPSRTNPDGQPWGYPVFDPAAYMPRFGPPRAGGLDDAPLAFFGARVEKIFDEFDGLRIDHPHGLVCPWVYTRGRGDPVKAVRHGARLFESPAEDDHPELARFSIVRPDQVVHGREPYADERVRDLTPEQIDTYAVFVDRIVEAASRHGRGRKDILCEVLSTCPLPLRRVMERVGLGRFRVTQKASLSDASDGYRSEHAEPDDWIMVGNHDTDPLLRVLDRFRRSGTLAARAEYLAARLEPDASRRATFAASLLASEGRFVQAMFADLFASRARNVMVFFADLFGTRTVYNTPGVVSADNWTLRVPNDFRGAYRTSCAAGSALDVPRALAMAMRARGAAFVQTNRALIDALEREG